MTVFIDTSALYSLMDKNEVNHTSASQIWQRILVDGQVLVATNYVLLETNALLQKRLGMAAVADLQTVIAPILDIQWVDDALHLAGVGGQLAANRRRLSLVDCVSFEACRRLGIRDVFAFDPHFAELGFRLLTP